MGAKVLKLESRETTQAEKKTAQHRRASAMAEDRTVRYLLTGKDERGRAIYFLRVGVTGLRRRVFGPFRRKSHAITAFDGLLCNVLEAFVDAENEGMDQAVGNSAREMIELPAGLALVKLR